MMKKNKGSSLITVVIIFSILITVGTALLSMTIGDYKMRTKESKRIENLYGSDSGLDVAYDIMIKTFDSATQFGDEEVKALKSKDGNPDSPNDTQYKEYQKEIYYWKHYNDDKDESHKISKTKIKEEIEKRKKEIEILINKEFRRTFKNFIYVNEAEISKSEDDSNQSKEYKPNKLKELIEARKYVDSVSGIKEGDLSYKEVSLTSQANKPELVADISDPENENEEEVYTIKITSTFETKEANTNIIGTNTRKVQTTYNIVVPDYKDIAFSESISKVQNSTVLNDKVMVIGRNMNVNQYNKITIDGDIFVWGDSPTITNKVYDKYKGGINLKSCAINFNGEVVTEKTFNIENNVKSNINGNLYARNVYMGNLNGSPSENSNLTIKESKKDDNKGNISNKNSEESGQVVLDNDITLKSRNTNVSIDNFYGINDKNIKYGNVFNASSEGTNERTSSSIIVNGDENSNIKINNKAYIMGVAHIDTFPEYQTGESTGVKGNYIAYATPLNNEEKFEYYDPLQLLDEDNILNKSKHFVDYWQVKLSDVNTGGIQLPDEIHSVGTIVYKDKLGNIQVKDSSYTLDIDNKIKEKQLEYASKVYAMGKKVGINWYDTLGNLGSPVNYLMKLDNIPIDYDLESENSNNEKAIFNNEDNKTIIIRGKNASSIYYDGSNVIEEKDKIVINADSGEVNSFIATNGNVIIDGEINFNGNIVTEGNLTIQGNQEKNIKYDKELCDRIKASNEELFCAVFGDSSDEENIDDSEPNLNNKDDLNIQYDLNKFLKTRIWKIIK